jgi:PIN domain nuclease of toxin-antitoxin system
VKLLLDTCTFLWIVTDSRELSLRARELFQEPTNAIYLSSVSAWETAVKYALGRLPLPETPDRFVGPMRAHHGIESLPLEEEAVLMLPKLPELHRDPFDRMLVCQALAQQSVVLTPRRHDPPISR